MDGIPIGPLFFGAGLIFALPFAVLAVFWGGRGIVYGIVGLFAVMIGWVVWATFVSGGTGMEGLGAVIAFGVWLATCLWGGIIYVFVGAVQFLPWQRRNRAGKQGGQP